MFYFSVETFLSAVVEKMGHIGNSLISLYFDSIGWLPKEIHNDKVKTPKKDVPTEVWFAFSISIFVFFLLWYKIHCLLFSEIDTLIKCRSIFSPFCWRLATIFKSYDLKWIKRDKFFRNQFAFLLKSQSTIKSAMYKIVSLCQLEWPSQL